MASKIQFEIYSSANVFICQTEGELSFDDLYDHVLELMSDYRFVQGMNGFYDFTRVTKLTGDLEKWKALASGMSSEEVIPNSAKTSIVIARHAKEVKELMLNYLYMTASSNISYQLFYHSQWSDAAKFVGLDENSKELQHLTPLPFDQLG